MQKIKTATDRAQRTARTAQINGIAGGDQKAKYKIFTKAKKKNEKRKRNQTKAHRQLINMWTKESMY